MIFDKLLEFGVELPARFAERGPAAHNVCPGLAGHLLPRLQSDEVEKMRVRFDSQRYIVQAAPVKRNEDEGRLV